MVQEPEINAFSIDRSESALRERLELSLWRIENLEYDIHEKAREYFQTEASLLSGRIRTVGGVSGAGGSLPLPWILQGDIRQGDGESHVRMEL